VIRGLHFAKNWILSFRMRMRAGKRTQTAMMTTFITFTSLESIGGDRQKDKGKIKSRPIGAAFTL